jgi:hypothetical protein
MEHLTIWLCALLLAACAASLVTIWLIFARARQMAQRKALEMAQIEQRIQLALLLAFTVSMLTSGAILALQVRTLNKLPPRG